jgi:phenylpropionate dioxygenase-like ring-hydroxylating dioxygenase large terminal subunit
VAQTVTDPHKWASQYPELGTEALPTEPYISEEYFERERTEVFGKTWLNVGRIDDCPDPGSYFVREIAVCSASILIVHGQDGEVRAFHNVCSHRGNMLVWNDRGCKKKNFTCCVHGWTYDTEGRLKGIMDEGGFAELDKDKLGLTPVNCGVWQGFIFVNLQKEPEETLEEYLGPFAEKLNDCPFDQLKLRFRFDIEERTNWKIALDAQNEIYHLPVLGPVHDSFRSLYETNEQGYTRLSLFERLGEKHTVWSTNPNTEYESRGLEKELLAKANFSDVSLPTNGIFDFYVVFPNLVVGLLADSIFTFNFWPLAVDRTVWEIRMYLPEPKNAGDLFIQHFWKGKIRDVLAEDIAGHETSFAALASRGKSHFVLQDEEIQIRAFHKTLHSYVQPAENGSGRNGR